MTRIMNKKTVRDRLTPAGHPVPPTRRSAFVAYLRREREAWASKVRDADIQPE